LFLYYILGIGVLLIAAFLTFENFYSVLSEDIAIPMDPEASTGVSCGLETIVSPVVTRGKRLSKLSLIVVKSQIWP
jgi:hypothetical protein